MNVSFQMESASARSGNWICGLRRNGLSPERLSSGFIALFMLLGADVSFSQPSMTLKADVFSSLGGLAGYGSLYAAVTLGESFVGPAAATGLVENAGFWHRGLVPTSAVDGLIERIGFPAQPRLYPNVPNPFSSRTSVRYSIPSGTAHETPVVLSVFDVAGRLVRTLQSGVCEPGPHVVVWDRRNDAGLQVGAGIYFLQFRSAAFRATQRLVVVK